MDKLVCLLLLVLSVFLCFHYGSAIRCYNCNSHFQADCGYPHGAPLNESYSIECDSNATRCRKIHQWVDFTEDGLGPDERIVRECGYNQTNERPCYYRQGLGGRMEVCTCYTDDCNTASRKGLNDVVIGLLTMASVVIIFNSFK